MYLDNILKVNKITLGFFFQFSGKLCLYFTFFIHFEKCLKPKCIQVLKHLKKIISSS